MVSRNAGLPMTTRKPDGMKREIAIILLLAGVCGTSLGQGVQLPPPNYQNRIVEGKIYNPAKSVLWTNMATGTTRHGSKLVVASIGPKSVGFYVYKDIIDWGSYQVGTVIGQEFVKEIVVWNHPFHDVLTTGEVITNKGTSPATRSFLAMKVANWSTNQLSFEAYDCGVPDTIENRKKFLPPPQK